MAKLARIVMPGMPHHITHRGNRKCVLFWDDSDRKTYLRILFDQMIKLGLRIWAYALMTNHVHFVAVPKEKDSLGVFFRSVDGTYADYFNTKYDQVGHRWGERFKSSVLDEPYLLNAVRYVERNPVRAGMVTRAEDYAWSSAAPHCGLRDDRLLSDDLPLLGQIPDWSAWLRDELSAEEMTVLRSRTQTGRPCGDKEFLRNLGTQLGRDLLPKRRGPVPKSPQPSLVEPSLWKELGDE
jgi:putative transposase